MFAKLCLETAGFELHDVGIVEGYRFRRIFGKPEAERVFAGKRISGIGRGQAKKADRRDQVS